MNKIRIKITTYISLVAWVVSMVWTTGVYATDLQITGNGDNSSSDITIKANNDTNIVQQNQNTTTNNVQTIADTGNNTTSDNTGQVNVVTGDATSISSVNNNANTSVINSSSCCQNSGTTIIVSGNGENSNNAVNVQKTQTTTVNVYQIAEITNNISGHADSGHNEANNNTVLPGSSNSSNTHPNTVSIKTGDVKVIGHVVNANINSEKAKIALNSFGPTIIKVKQNGTDSTNVVTANFSNENIINIEHIAKINNTIEMYGNSGNNAANNNNGKVAIVTGNVLIDTSIINKNINVSDVSFTCCEETDHEKPDDGDHGNGGTPTPSLPPSNNNGGGGSSPSSSGGGSSSGSTNNTGGSQIVTTSTTPILPVTGGNSVLMLTIANIAMFLLGLYLRIRSGRSPATIA